MHLVRSLLLLTALALPASAQSLTLVRQTWGDYSFETRVDTSGVDCPAAERPARLFTFSDVETCGSGRWMTLRFRGAAVDSLDGPHVWLGVEADTVAMARATAGPPYPATVPVPDGAIRDLTGDGAPDVVLGTYSGGMHCCVTLWVVTLGADGPRLLDRIEARDSEPWAEDTDGDGVVEMHLADFAFAYWNASFAGSPAPTVALVWDGTRLAPSWRHMDRSPMPEANLAAAIRLTRASPSWAERNFPPADYWGTLLDLLYAGRGAQAARFAEGAWAGDAVGRTVFLRWFADTLHQSPYGAAVADRNRDAVDWL